MNPEQQTTLASGEPVTPDHRDIDPETGMQKAYVVLSKDERDKGFVRPLRRSYTHLGPKQPEHLRDLTPEEHQRYDEYGYVKFEEYDETRNGLGRFWTLDELARMQRGCGAVTRMGNAIAETYARDPKFYGSTFCVQCKTHYPVREFVWLDSQDPVGS